LCEDPEKELPISGKKLAIRVDMPFSGSTVNTVTALVFAGSEEDLECRKPPH
jgi:hypothetical protein